MMRSASPFDLRVGVDRGAGADVGRVDRPAEQRLDGRRTGVERLRLELDVGAEGFGEDPLLDADERRGVGDVREVAEPQGDLFARKSLSAAAAVVGAAPWLRRPSFRSIRTMTLWRIRRRRGAKALLEPLFLVAEPAAQSLPVV